MPMPYGIFRNMLMDTLYISEINTIKEYEKQPHFVAGYKNKDWAIYKAIGILDRELVKHRNKKRENIRELKALLDPPETPLEEEF